MTKLLQGKVCLVTGGGRGIGRAIAEAFAAEGAALHLVARSKHQLDEAVLSCKAKGAAEVEAHTTDLTSASAIDQLANTLLQRHKKVDVLVNNAGKLPGQPGPTNGDIDEWQTTMQLNVLAPMQLTNLLAPGMQEQQWGLIINMGSVAAVEPMPGAAAYAASKHALRGWSLSCYGALRNDNIKVVLINPAAVKTDMIAGLGFIPERTLLPEDIAEAAMLAVRTSQNACPQEITMRLTKNAMKT